MTKLFKYWLCAVFMVLCLLGGGSTAAYAATSFDNVNVMEDLAGSTIDGVVFDTANYPYLENGMPKVIYFAEYCYGYKAEQKDDYALYVYLYNPSGKEIKRDKNTIQIATGYNGDSPVRYDKFSLTLCNSSTGTLDTLFYKFRVNNVSSVYNRVNENNTSRRYDVSGVELNYGSVDDFPVGNVWIYSGFAKGCGADEDADSTLSCVTNTFETVSLDVYDTYYRYLNGLSTQSQISSVYFGVDNVLLDKYGKLQKIHASWLEARTSTIIVAKNDILYDALRDYIGVDLTSSSNKPNYYLYQRVDDLSGVNEWGYNVGAVLEMTKLAYLFNATNTSDNTVSSKAMKEYMTWYSELHGKEVAGKYSDDLFSWVDNSVTDTTIDADSIFTLDGFTTGSGLLDWFYELFYSSLENTPLEDIQPIYIVKSSDVIGSDEEIAERLFIAKEDVKAFKEKYNENTLAGKTTVLFRFAVSDYTAYNISACETGFLKTPHNDWAYMAEQSVYLDFDIIDLTFSKDNVFMVLPVVSNPIDVIGGITPPVESDGLPWWVWALIALACLILIAVVVNPVASLLLLILKGVWWIVSAPFRFIGWIVRKIKDGKET